MLTDDQLSRYRQRGHVTVDSVFSEQQIADALADVDSWGLAFLEALPEAEKKWYLESGGQSTALRKLDSPVFQRDVFRSLAQDAALVSIVEQLIGPGVSVFFSQVFCKPPEVGGPKPVHQDNFYFGPDDPDATLTVWIALDSATIENGCLFYGDGSHLDKVYEHQAPPDEPYNLQIPAEVTSRYPMSAAPVAAGGISFHHGNTWHQSSSNKSPAPRRAAAFHYLRNDAALVNPALEYDLSVVVKIT